MEHGDYVVVVNHEDEATLKQLKKIWQYKDIASAQSEVRRYRDEKGYSVSGDRGCGREEEKV